MKSLEKMTISDKYVYLKGRIYENIKERPSGKLYIETHYLNKAAQLIGIDYSSLSCNGKRLFIGDILSERFFLN
jgi:hypothetical protein